MENVEGVEEFSRTVTLNERAKAVAIVVADGDLRILQDDPLIAMMPPPLDECPPVLLQGFIAPQLETMTVEVSVPFAFSVPDSHEVNAWIARVPANLYNAYVVRVGSHDEYGRATLAATSSLLVPGLSTSVLASALELLARAWQALSIDFIERFADLAECRVGPDAHLADVGELTPAETRSRFGAAARLGQTATGDLHAGYL